MRGHSTTTVTCRLLRKAERLHLWLGHAVQDDVTYKRLHDATLFNFTSVTDAGVFMALVV